MFRYPLLKETQAAEIAALRAENARLRAALEPFAEIAATLRPDTDYDDAVMVAAGHLIHARAALQSTEQEGEGNG